MSPRARARGGSGGLRRPDFKASPRCIAYIAYIAALAFAFAPFDSAIASVGDKIHQTQAQIDALRARLDRKRVQLRFQEQREADLARQLSETDANISHVTATLGELDENVRWNERRLAWNGVQLDAAEATLKRHDDALKRRLVDAYERGVT